MYVVSIVAYSWTPPNYRITRIDADLWTQREKLDFHTRGTKCASQIKFTDGCCLAVNSIIRPSIIRNLDYLAWKFSNSLKMGVSAAVIMDTRTFIFCACAHIHCCLSILSGGSRRGLSYSIIRLSGMAQEQRCPDNRGSTVYFSFSWQIASALVQG